MCELAAATNDGGAIEMQQMRSSDFNENAKTVGFGAAQSGLCLGVFRAQRDIVRQLAGHSGSARGNVRTSLRALRACATPPAIMNSQACNCGAAASDTRWSGRRGGERAKQITEPRLREAGEARVGCRSSRQTVTAPLHARLLQ
jgi:hypothetical protein